MDYKNTEFFGSIRNYGYDFYIMSIFINYCAIKSSISKDMLIINHV
jgi:hypothetical protein